MKNLIFSVILFALLGCSCDKPLCRQAQLTNQIITQHAGLEKKNNNLDLVGFGSAGPTKTTQFVFVYASYRKVGVGEARRLYFDVAEDALRIINANEEIRPYLSDYPYTLKNLDLRVLFFSTFGTYVAPPHVALILFIPEKNEISYSYYLPNGVGFINDKDIIETPEEAMHILLKERNEQKSNRSEQ